MSKQFTIRLDDSSPKGQAEDLKNALLDKFGSLENIPGDIFSDIESLPLDVILGKGTTTINASGPDEIIYRLRFGRSFESLISTIRAYKVDHN